jgi:hypothetical protein
MMVHMSFPPAVLSHGVQGDADSGRGQQGTVEPLRSFKSSADLLGSKSISDVTSYHDSGAQNGCTIAHAWTLPPTGRLAIPCRRKAWGLEIPYRGL